jgi:hypothetical protein
VLMNNTLPLGEGKERWRVLCQQASTERNPARFLAIMLELMLEVEKKTTQQQRPPQISDRENLTATLP